ncbi:MAG: hypothetical protein CML20_16705 [Rheinheimera sp.]|uniref:CC0125/CC1285 family lipoprotein n=1 Tax=Arsukibacterium sp. UBA3155 TaxID=1946058 RepID=UPI000C96C89E|nr:hypothetical protein [Arsukibacterium sp. UBA3155]MAD76401.1 hypothetical protein [Rheinheimera sp.]|tara:strand:- start:39471 stop:39962 length:492 start_codon:yes stop_codon:yes gene_type:complete
MKQLNKLISFFMLLTALLLTACSSQPDYRPANGNGFGYKEQQISANFYRVSYKARGDNSDEAKAYAMRRATELTAAQGYDWFIVVDKETMTERQQDSANRLGAGYQTTTVRDCGLLGCSSRTVQQPNYEVGIAAGGKEQVEAVLEIRMGKGVMPDGGNSYPAR